MPPLRLIPNAPFRQPVDMEHAPPTAVRRAMIVSAILLLAVPCCNAWCLGSRASAGGPLSHSQALVQRLTADHTGLVDGREFREAVRIAAAPAGELTEPINVWIDRKANPNTPVSPGPLGPTRYASLSRIAAAADCVCVPLDNCVLIGRPDWVATMLERFFSLDENRSDKKRVHRQAPPIDLRWPELTTPSEAMQRLRQRLAGQSLGYREPVSLPHDLWPAVSMNQISPHVMAELITGQFLSAEPSANPIRRTYGFPRQRRAFASLAEVDPNAVVETKGVLQTVTASPAAHVWLCRQLLGSADPDGDGRADEGRAAAGGMIERLRQDPRTFSMTVRNEPAGRVIETLVASMKVRCQFDASAAPGLKQRVSFTAKDQTLWALLRLIADEASLKIEAAEDSLRISAEEDS